MRENLGVAGQQLFPGATPVGRTKLYLYTHLGENPVDPVHRGIANGLRLYVDKYFQGFTRARVATVGIPRLHQQLPGILDGLTPGLTVYPIVDIRVHPRFAVQMSGNTRGNQIMGGNTVALVENIEVFLGIKRYLQGPPQLAFILGIAPDDGVTHIEAVVVNTRFHVGRHGNVVIHQVS